MKLLVIFSVFLFVNCESSNREPKQFNNLLGGLTGGGGKSDENLCPSSCTKKMYNNELQAAKNAGSIKGLESVLPHCCGKCPAGSGGKRIGNHCYSVGTTALNHVAASRACKMLGGYLAEPGVTAAALASFATSIRAKFATEFTTIAALADESENCHIGLRRERYPPANGVAGDSDLFTFPHCGAILPNDDALLTGASNVAGVGGVTVANARSYGITRNAGTLFGFADITSTAAANIGCYICQYDLVEM